MAIDTPAAPVADAPEVLLPISYKAPIVMGVFGLLATVFFGLMGTAGETTTFVLAMPGDAITLPDFAVPSRPSPSCWAWSAWPWPGCRWCARAHASPPRAGSWPLRGRVHAVVPDLGGRPASPSR